MEVRQDKQRDLGTNIKCSAARSCAEIFIMVGTPEEFSRQILFRFQKYEFPDRKFVVQMGTVLFLYHPVSYRKEHKE